MNLSVSIRSLMNFILKHFETIQHDRKFDYATFAASNIVKLSDGYDRTIQMREL